MKNVKVFLLSVLVFVFFAACSVEPTMDVQESTEPELPLVDFELNSRAISSVRVNNYPIVFVGGILTWGRDEMAGMKYWGGFVDLQEKMTAAGYTTVTSSVGPLSSYWDRACELYAQTKGTIVDYGAAHAKKYGHERFGRDYRGKALVPGWGTGSNSKIHLIVHSMGGPTARAMASLLYYGSQEEQDAAVGQEDPNEGASTLFKGGQHLISGLVTISSPHDGTTITKIGISGTNLESNLVQKLAGTIAGLSGGNLSTFYDFKMDQWGLKRSNYNSQDEYMSAVANSAVWNTEKSRKDFSSLYDGSLEGAKVFNSWAKDDPDVYYFSTATKASRKALFSSNQLPLVSTNPLLVLSGFATHLGSFRGGDYSLSTSWLENDGTVNTTSQYGPTQYNNWFAGMAVSNIVKYSGTPKKGAWNNLGLNDTWDHLDIVGNTLTPVLPWYLKHAKLLASLSN